MERLSGESILQKIAIGRIHIYKKDDRSVRRHHVEDTAAEVERFNAAKETALKQLQQIYEKTREQLSEDNAAVFKGYMIMIEDYEYLDPIYDLINEQHVNAEYAVSATGDHFAEMFAGMDDEYMQARAADVKDISSRLISVLSGGETDMELSDPDTVKGTSGWADMKTMDEPVILMADDLSPSETVRLDRDKILAFVTRHGSANSHTAILARTMNIPAIIGIDVQDDWEGKTAVVDGYTGMVIIDPDFEILAQMTAKIEGCEKKQESFAQLKGKETVTKSGKKIHLYANIGSAADLALALQNDAEGVGLFRSELLCLESGDYPSEEEQFQAYKTAAESMAGKKVVIRTLDMGADKQADYFGLEKEANPAMGYRGIRICLDRQDIFRTQLRALLRAGSFGNISIMFPMIISVDEVLKSKLILKHVRSELFSEGFTVGDVEVGIMIETPASVLISEELAEEVDFFSIGTNDLTQFTLAADRQNPKLDNIYDPHHPAVLKSIQMVIENGHKHGAWVGICGELAADTTLTQTFIDMGIDELSVSPPMILPVRDAVRKAR